MSLKLIAAILAPDDCLECGREGSIWCDGCLASAPQAKAVAQPHLDGLSAGTVFGGMAKEVIHALKYERRQSGAVPLARLIERALPHVDFDAVTAVPGSPARLRARGYSQAELIARELAGRLGLPFERLLVRLSSGSQVGFSRRQRQESVRDAFAALRASGRILLVDDVMTTGATLSECAKVLKEAGAETVWGVVAARD